MTDPDDIRCSDDDCGCHADDGREVAGLRERLATAERERDEARTLVRYVDNLGTGYLWRRPDGEEVVLNPVEIVTLYSADRVSYLEALVAERDDYARRLKATDNDSRLQRDMLAQQLDDVRALKAGDDGEWKRMVAELDAMRPVVEAATAALAIHSPKPGWEREWKDPAEALREGWPTCGGCELAGVGGREIGHCPTRKILGPAVEKWQHPLIAAASPPTATQAGEHGDAAGQGTADAQRGAETREGPR